MAAGGTTFTRLSSWYSTETVSPDLSFHSQGSRLYYLWSVKARQNYLWCFTVGFALVSLGSDPGIQQKASKKIMGPGVLLSNARGFILQVSHCYCYCYSYRYSCYCYYQKIISFAPSFYNGKILVPSWTCHKPGHCSNSLASPICRLSISTYHRRGSSNIPPVINPNIFCLFIALTEWKASESSKYLGTEMLH